MNFSSPRVGHTVGKFSTANQRSVLEQHFLHHPHPGHESSLAGLEAIILAGGLGTRLRSLIKDLPKCMVPIDGHPFLHYLLEYLKRQGIRRIILSLGYLHETVEKWITRTSTLSEFEFVYSIEQEPLGTGGAIKLALTQAIGNQVLILNGDTLFDVDIPALVTAHRQRGATLSMALKPMEHFDRYGTVTTDGEGRVTAFHEKRFCSQGMINGGVYILQTTNSLFDGTPSRFSFETEILEKQVDSGNLYGFPDNGYFIDIGIPSDYAKAEADFKNLFDGTTR